ncbi:ABC transporter permease [Piscirickettsia litoralis]|uniref:ABC transporter permease n=1 Tax=Piscirickettsia litoralis TaxID=1891921 RepID=UPI000ABE570F|nr:ABC transporter permease [Piscirickettsia litoralis]
MFNPLIQFLANHQSELVLKLYQHIYISITALFVAILIGIPLGVLIYYYPRFRPFTLATTNILQTIPSLALLAFFIPWLGIGYPPTLVALLAYALLPIVRSTYTGLESVPAESIHAAEGLHLSKTQSLKLILLPLACPSIISGIRVAAAMTIGITTIAAFIGAGGLGDFITQGLSTSDNKLILLGTIPTALLALVVDAILALIGILLIKRKREQIKFKRTGIFFITVLFIATITMIGSHFINYSKKNHDHHR